MIMSAFLVSTVDAAKETFDRSKPHVNPAGKAAKKKHEGAAKKKASKEKAAKKKAAKKKHDKAAKKKAAKKKHDKAAKKKSAKKKEKRP